jgi:gluconolactonase
MELKDVEVLAEGLAFPEGPVALDDGTVMLSEIAAGRISRVGPGREVSVVAEVGGGPNGTALGPDGALYVCNNGGIAGERTAAACIQRVDVETGRVESLYSGCEGRPLQSPNDLVFDETGHFWFTDFADNCIFYASADGNSITRAVCGVRGPNGIGLSPEGDVLYWAQTYTRQVHRRHLDGPGRVVNTPRYEVQTLIRGETPDPWTVVVGLPGMQELDSLAVDSAGVVCVGTLLEGGLTVVKPDDGSYETYTLPAALADGAVTNICFGGRNLQTAYITCSTTGRLISCRWPRPGLRLAFQQMPTA